MALESFMFPQWTEQTNLFINKALALGYKLPWVLADSSQSKFTLWIYRHPFRLMNKSDQVG
jgi:hypothetical protein